MALKVYRYRGSTYQFDDRDVPEGAVPIDEPDEKAAPLPKNKARTPRNKARTPQNKAAAVKATPETPADAPDPDDSEW